MKKKSLFIGIAFSLILVVLSFLFVQEIMVIQAAETTQKDAKYTSTVMNTTDDMSVYYSGVCKPRQSEAFFDKYDSYDIYYKNEPIIAVTLRKSSSPADNGFYQIEFDIPGTKKSVFITGLTAKNVQTAQDSLSMELTRIYAGQVRLLICLPTPVGQKKPAFQVKTTSSSCSASIFLTSPAFALLRSAGL